MSSMGPETVKARTGGGGGGLEAGLLSGFSAGSSSSTRTISMPGISCRSTVTTSPGAIIHCINQNTCLT